jgi:hypothetical protein
MRRAMMNPFLEFDNWHVLAQFHPYSPKREESEHLILSYFDLPLNLLTFTPFSKKWLVNVRLIAPPLSVSSSGYEFKTDSGQKELQWWLQSQSGFVVGLNLSDLQKKDFYGYQTLPSMYMAVNFERYLDYLNALRSPYRHRLKKARAKFSNVLTVHANPIDFPDDFYTLYEAVFNKSSYPIEKCSISYFKTFDAEFLLYYDQGSPLGFSQFKIINDTMYFIFCGLDYTRLKEKDTYYNLLIDLINIGIDRGVKKIDFGQTTESIKQKLGCKMESRYFYIWHKSYVIRKLVQPLAKVIAYKPPSEVYHVFKE